MHNAFADQATVHLHSSIVQLLHVRTRQAPPERQPFQPFTPYNAEHNQHNSMPVTTKLQYFVANRQDGLSEVSLQPFTA